MNVLTTHNDSIKSFVDAQCHVKLNKERLKALSAHSEANMVQSSKHVSTNNAREVVKTSSKMIMFSHMTRRLRKTNVREVLVLVRTRIRVRLLATTVASWDTLPVNALSWRR